MGLKPEGGHGVKALILVILKQKARECWSPEGEEESRVEAQKV